MTKKQQKEIDARISRIYARSCEGVQVSIWDLGKISDEGKRLIAEGADDEKLGAGLRAFVDRIKVG